MARKQYSTRDSFTIEGIEEFNAALKKILKKNKENQRKILATISHSGLRELQRATPKDTTRAAASWNNTVNKAPSEWKQPEGKDHYAMPPFRDMSNIKYDSLVNLSNNIEYIIPLEEGHSKQRKYFVRDTVAAITTQLTTATRKESKRKVK